MSTYTKGQKFGNITFLKEIEPRMYRNYRYRKGSFLCFCGETFENNISKIKNKEVKSCGCLLGANFRKHGLFKGGKRPDTLIVWSAMKARCHNPKHDKYKYYGKRGLTVCKEWKDSFETFHKWAKENGHSKELEIDRKDNSKGYEPDNCRFVTRKQNMRNRSSTFKILYKGELRPFAEIVEETKINYTTAYCRYIRGTDIDYIFYKGDLRSLSVG